MSFIVPARVMNRDSVSLVSLLSIFNLFQSTNLLSHSALVPVWQKSVTIHLQVSTSLTRSPPEADLNVNILFIHIVKIVEDDITFGLVESNNP